ncbi:glycosyltransferase family 4 protein [Flavilitoribacter nigricans]|uniref:Glycosyl transferase family 1 n=1 Tax=Flavilitoribacter nigricans (strain ATCC 23147 / DSM 23189 / NBRC 102662 / NCIMB 1420 / SS-2) TaxID=1122177 RepID=A0A2D0NGD8_FLAN2|nr:glycosyltransferase family 4 protein [Flavilitoribacter nigricans]PHN07561.1 glycosyl transferase family 1 [Flavilitoribacter nigricans DSM 23189 = NBRC 102662]
MQDSRKKVLIISYYWPPSGGIAVLRCLKWAKYLREFGWEPVVFTAEDAHYPSLDPSNEKDIPEGMTVLRGKIFEPYALYKRFTGQDKDANVNNVFYVQDEQPGWTHRFSVWVRSNFFIPDARAMWIRPSVRFLLDYLQEHPVDAIVSDGPPHSNTRIATLLKQKTGIPWLADFQDPWTQVDYYQMLSLTSWADRKHRRLEQEAFRAADKTTIVSPSWKAELEKIGARNVSVIPWGYDPEDFENIEAAAVSGFTFMHLGIMGHDRNPETFFRVLREISEEYEDFLQHLRLELVGQVDFSVQEAYSMEGLSEQVTLPGSVPRGRALELTAGSPVLLLLLNKQDNVQGRIPGKLFEYLAARRPILVLGPPDSDVANIVRETASGVTCDYEDAAGIKEAVLKLYQQYLAGSLQKPLRGEIEQYSVRNLTQRLATYLDEITDQ